MYLIVIAWIYVVLMMSVAEATNSNGTVLGAIITFVLYGALPVALVVYLMGTPARNKAIKRREAELNRLAASRSDTGTVPANDKAVISTAESIAPDAGSHAPGGSEGTATEGTMTQTKVNTTIDSGAGVPPVRKEP